MIISIKPKFNSLSLSNEYFIYLSSIVSILFISCIFYYSYSYSTNMSDKKEEMVRLTQDFEQKLGNTIEAFKDKKKKNGDDLNAAIQTKEFQDYLKKIEENKGISFILVDNGCKLIFSSSNNSFSANSTICKQTSVDLTKGPSGFLSQSLLAGTTHYSYYQKLRNSPFIVFTGFDKNKLEQELHNHVLPKLYELIIVGLFCLIILYFFRKRLITPISTLSNYATLISKGNTSIKIPKQNSIELYNLAKALVLVKHYIKRKDIYRQKLELANEIINTSAEAREDFVKSINQELTYPLKEILICAEILLKDISEKQYLSLDIQKTIKCVEKIREAALNIKSKTSSSLNLSHFDFNNIIKQAVQINLKHSFIKNITLESNLAENIPTMVGDELKLTKIMVGLISQSIDNSSENQKIIISTSTFLKETFAFLEITIKDSSFGLSEEELKRIQESIGWKDENTLFSNMEYTFIEKFVKMHNGTLVIENKMHEGRTVTLTFPIERDQDPISKTGKDNLYYLHSKKLEKV